MKKVTQKETRQPASFSLPLLLTLVVGCAFVYSLFSHEQIDTPLLSALTKTSQAPTQARLHLELAKQYVKLGNRDQASKELDLVKKLTSNSNVLGETTAVEQELDAGPERLRKEQSFWQDVVGEHPTYRDGWVQLYFIALNLNNKERVNQIREKLKELDPNYVVDQDR